MVIKKNKIKLGKALVRCEGTDITFVTTSWMAIEAKKASEVLKKRGICAEIIDVRSISPFDSETVINSVRKTKRCIVADYDWVFNGFSAEIASQISHHCFKELKAPVERLGFEFVPCPTARNLENLFYPSAVNLIRTTEKMLGLNEADLTNESFFSYENKFKGPF